MPIGNWRMSGQNSQHLRFELPSESGDEKVASAIRYPESTHTVLYSKGAARGLRRVVLIPSVRHDRNPVNIFEWVAVCSLLTLHGFVLTLQGSFIGPRSWAAVKLYQACEAT
jgi:hypothetical protein